MPESSPSSLCFLCFGVGAIGTYIGGSLVLAGHRVVFVERPGVAEEVRQKGLAVTVEGVTRRVAQPEVVESIEAALQRGPFDTALLAVKAYDTEPLAESLRPFAAALPPILSFQNGVDNEPLLASVVGKEKVIYGTVTTAVGRRAAGDIQVERLRGIGVALNHPLGPTLLASLDAAGLRAKGFANPHAMKWSKMLTNLLANASSAILDLPAAAIFADPGLFAMEMRQYREALQVMAAQGIPVVDLPATPVRLLSWAASRLPLPLARPLLRRALGSGRGAKMPSFHIDLRGGRGKSEVEFLNGAVARYGKRLKVRAPVNETLTDILTRLTTGDLPLDTYAHQPEKLLAAIPRA